jgi:hypothetical protein
VKTLCRKSSLGGRTKWSYRFRDRCKNTVSLWLYRVCTCISFCFHITGPTLITIFHRSLRQCGSKQIHQHPIALSARIHFSAPPSRPCLSGTIPYTSYKSVGACVKCISCLKPLMKGFCISPIRFIKSRLHSGPPLNPASSTSFSIRSHAGQTKVVLWLAADER